MADTAPSDIRNVVEKGLGTYDITIDGELNVVSQEESKYTLEVPFRGELLLAETVEQYSGPLLYNKEGEILWEGVRDGKLLLIVDLDN